MYRLVINRYSHTKTETASEGGLDPTAEEIGVVDQHYHNASTYISVARPSRSLTLRVGSTHRLLSLSEFHDGGASEFRAPSRADDFTPVEYSNGCD